MFFDLKYLIITDTFHKMIGFTFANDDQWLQEKIIKHLYMNNEYKEHFDTNGPYFQRM